MITLTGRVLAVTEGGSTPTATARPWTRWPHLPTAPSYAPTVGPPSYRRRRTVTSRCSRTCGTARWLKEYHLRPLVSAGAILGVKKGVFLPGLGHRLGAGEVHVPPERDAAGAPALDDTELDSSRGLVEPRMPEQVADRLKVMSGSRSLPTAARRLAPCCVVVFVFGSVGSVARCA